MIRKNRKHKNDQAGEILVVGAGISGATLAERYASLGKRVIVMEKRGHIGGNCYDYTNRYGIRVSKYGAHLFHTNHEDVWRYVNRFTRWRLYVHRVRAYVDGKFVPVPVNIETVNGLLGTGMRTEEEMKQWLRENTVPHPDPKNGEEATLDAVGPYLYEKLFKHYTYKQWAKWPSEMHASVLKRIPVRTGFDDRYFSDKYQALPAEGYTKLFKNMLENPRIEIRLRTDYLKVRHTLPPFEKIFFTGPIDRFFEEQEEAPREKLEYRSIRFVHKTLDREYFQPYAVVNYPNTYRFTRIVEYKHLTGQKNPKTTIVKEYTTDKGDPYYPVPNDRNRALYARYQKLTEKLKGVYFVGRLANYKYFNMDAAFKNALDLFYSLEPYAGKI